MSDALHPISAKPMNDETAPGAALPALFWRSLEERARTQEFRDAVEREFPAAAPVWDDSTSRRRFLKLMSASLALAGISATSGCYKHPQGRLVPYPKAPEETIPGRPTFFATAMPLDGFARGVLVESHEGRPIKLEGNPDHPASLGASDIFMQASILELYDPNRTRVVGLAGETSTWSTFYGSLLSRLQSRRGDGRGIRLLTGGITSPTFNSQLDEFLKQFPNAAWHEHEPMHLDRTRESSRLAFGSAFHVLYDFSLARTILSLGSDFLSDEPLSLRYARQFIDGRRVRRDSASMSRLYVAEPLLTLAGSMADHRVALPQRDIHALAGAVAAALGISAGNAPELPRRLRAWVSALVADLRAPEGGGPSLVVAGHAQPPAVHLLAHAINEALGNFGKTVSVIEPPTRQGSRSLGELARDMDAGAVDTLLIFEASPVYEAPADVDFGRSLERMSNQRSDGAYVNFTARLGLYDDETSFRCQWVLPAAHYLESWGDLRAYDGTTSLVQPLIAPLYEGRSQIELMEALLGRPQRNGLEILESYWKANVAEGNWDHWWLTTLQQGIVAGSAPPAHAPPAVRRDGAAPGSSFDGGGVELHIRPDPSVGTGRFANNGWLQELPKPFLKLTWDNAVVMNVATAQRLGNGAALKEGDVVRVTRQGRSIEGPVAFLPGLADNTVLIHLGYGRQRMGDVALENGAPRGFNAYRLRTSDSPWGGADTRVQPTGAWRELVFTRNHHALAEVLGFPEVKPSLKSQAIATPADSEYDLETRNRRIVRLATLQQFRDDPQVIQKLGGDADKKPLLSLYPGWDYEHGHQWGMSIDQTACIGCNACVIACQAENNIPVVGKEQVALEREMHWIRIDSYFGGGIDHPVVVHQPMPCQHCENAPCEYVCPVGATTHSDEGLNEMTYNRCIGTRYCSNNCPYKVRRFNFLLYSDYASPSRRLQYNPDVTVRSRGVMEKCTYCVQRINLTRIQSEKERVDLEELARSADSPETRERYEREARERERQIVRNLQTACQQSCPTSAIIFGDIRDPQAPVVQLKHEPHDYAVLKELSTKPRTTYLGRITNPNPKMAPGTEAPSA